MHTVGRVRGWRTTLALFIGINLLLGGVQGVALPWYIQTHSAPETKTTYVIPDTYGDIKLQGHAAIVYDLRTGETLYERNAEAQLPLASLTKLITIYAADDALSTTSPVTITSSALSADGDSGFKEGEVFAYNDLARIALVASSNDATQAIAEAASERRSVSNTDLLASVASALNLHQTYAVNGTGLDESTVRSGGYGSAKDVAILAAAVLAKNPSIARATVTPSLTIRSAAGVAHTLPSTNPDIMHVPGALLSKTGFTDLAGGNLVIVYDAGIAHPVAIVVLGSTREGRFSDVQALLADTLKHFAATPVPAG